MVVATIVALTASFWLAPLGSRVGAHTNAVELVENSMMLIGAAAMVVLALAFRPLGALLSKRLVLWVGVRSFSLYLVHEPVVTALAFAFQLTSSPLWFLCLAVMLSLGLTALFYRLIEAPAVVIAHRAGWSKERPDPAAAVG